MDISLPFSKVVFFCFYCKQMLFQLIEQHLELRLFYFFQLYYSGLELLLPYCLATSCTYISCISNFCYCASCRSSYLCLVSMRQSIILFPLSMQEHLMNHHLKLSLLCSIIALSVMMLLFAVVPINQHIVLLQ